jgi:flagellar secretion chaperone FliS
MEQGVLSSFASRSGLAAYQSVSVHGSVANADPHGLVLMLFDAASERLTKARSCIERGQMAQKAKLLHSCVILIAELRGSLNMSEGGALAQNLSNLYEYMAQQLLLANLKSDAKRITEVLGLVNEIRGAWVAIGPEVRKGGQQAVPAGMMRAAASSAANLSQAIGAAGVKAR